MVSSKKKPAKSKLGSKPEVREFTKAQAITYLKSKGKKSGRFYVNVKQLGDFDDKHHTEMNDKEYLQFIDRHAQKLREKSGVKRKETKTLTYYNLSTKDAKKKAFEKFKR